MDDEARNRLIAEAQLQEAREQIRAARANLPLGGVLIAIGVGLVTVSVLLPIGLLGNLMIGGIGFMFIPGGLAVIVRAAAATTRANRQIRELAPPAARVITDRRGS